MIIKRKSIKAIIFDLDGTLIDSDQDILKIINFIRFNYLNKKKVQINKIANYTAKGGNDLIKKTISKNKTKIYLNLFRDLYKNQKIRKSLVQPGVIKFFKFLKSKNIKIYICTNKPKFLTSKIINSTNLVKYISKYFCSDEYFYKKPDKSFFLKIIKLIKIHKNKILYIGDSLIDYEFCKNSLLKFVLFKNKRVNYPKKILLELYKSNKILYTFENVTLLRKKFL